MQPTARLLGLLALLTAAQPSSAPAQDSTLRVFLDCAGFVPGCDFDFFRTEITFVSYVRNRQDAQVHILVTTQQTGGGGMEYTLAFIGLKEFQGRADTLRHVAAPTHPAIRDLDQRVRLQRHEDLQPDRRNTVERESHPLAQSDRALVWGSASLVHDQLYLAKRGATETEILLQRRQLATSYQYYSFVGLSYSFGSIYNNVVNPRF